MRQIAPAACILSTLLLVLIGVAPGAWIRAANEASPDRAAALQSTKYEARNPKEAPRGEIVLTETFLAGPRDREERFGHSSFGF